MGTASTAESAPGVRYRADPYAYAEARALTDALDLAEPVAIALVRRGHRTVEQARAFLEAGERHDAALLTGIEEAGRGILGAIAAGRRITVHGDYDVDGISATAILVGALRRRGADCDWLIPDRAEDGYGVSPATVERLAARGTELLITADCGIASPTEIAAAASAGIETIVTDHHQPGPSLPDCAIVHPQVCGYPFEGLCGAAVASKLVEALAALEEGAPESADLDLVALATIADLVPLTGENRTLARLGIAELRRARRPGIKALLEIAGVEPEHLDEGDIAFRLAPRINAAGRLYRADAGVELMITDDPQRARTIATELDAANRERRGIEREVAAAAEAARRDLPEEQRQAAGLVLAGADWHPGVVGIAASRIVERHGRPAVLLSTDAEGRARGSGRGVAGFDLLAALEACSEHLDRFGGHRAAAGVELAAERIEPFRAAFAEAAAEQLGVEPAPAEERIDAVVGAEALDLRVAEQLAGLGPFGPGNPEVRLLVPWARVGEVRPMGEQGRHARFMLSSGRARAGGVAFNANGQLRAAERGPSDLTVRLELNHWNGATEPRAVLAASGPAAGADTGGCRCAGEADPHWWSSFEEELDRGDAGRDHRTDEGCEPGVGEGRRRIGHPDRSAVALIAELLSSGSRVLAVSADARRRAALASQAASPTRFGGAHAVSCGDCPAGSLADLADPATGVELVLTDWRGLAREPAAAGAFEHLVLVDPPPSAADGRLPARTGSGFLHEAWAGAGELPALAWAELWQPRAALAEIYRGLAGGVRTGTELGELLAGAGRLRRSPVVAARCVRVLAELGIAQLSGDPGARRLGIVSSERTELERSAAWRAYTVRYEEGLRFQEMRKAS
jgi:single-stranded-DNA-specific exonuclease